VEAILGACACKRRVRLAQGGGRVVRGNLAFAELSHGPRLYRASPCASCNSEYRELLQARAVGWTKGSLADTCQPGPLLGGLCCPP
jgi:hypothetical protein